MVSELSSFMPGKETLQAKSTKSGTHKDNTTCMYMVPNCFFFKFLLLNFFMQKRRTVVFKG